MGLSMQIKKSNKTKYKFWKLGLFIVSLGLIAVLVFNYYGTVKAATVDVLNGTGSFDNSTQTAAWSLVNTTGNSTWGLDTTKFFSGTGSGVLNSPSGTSTSYDSYVYYRFTTTDQPTAASLDLSYSKSYTNAQPTSGNWNVTAEIWQVGGTAPLQTITIDNGNTNVNWTNIPTQNITAITNANTQYELRLHTYGQTGYSSSSDVSTWFDNVKLNVTYNSTPPTVNSANVVDDHTVNIVFDKALDKTSAETIGNYSISPSLNINGAALQADGKTVQLITDNQTKGTNYTVTVNNVKDVSGNAMTTLGTATFTGVDTTPPQLTSASGVDQTTVNLSFSETVDATMAQNTSNYSISPSLAITKATLKPDGKTVQLTTANQTYGASYTVTVSNIQDTAGNVIAANSTTTFTGVDKTPPAITSSDVVNDGTVDVVFSKAMDPTTSQNAANYSISPSITVSSAILQSDGLTVRLVTSPQIEGTLYTINVNNVKDTAGNIITANSTATFTGVDTTPPKVVTASSPENTTVSVQFNEPVDATTAQNVANYSINPSLAISSAVLQADGITVKLTTASQTGGTSYAITVLNVKDTSGNIISGNNTANFTGTPAASTPPTVTRVVSISNTKVNVIFSKAVDPTTAQNTANYAISPILAVSDATLQSDGTTVTLTTASQSLGVSYTLTVANVKDTQGNIISSTGNQGQFSYSDATNNPHANFTVNNDKCSVCHVTHVGKGPQLMVQQTTTQLCYLCHDAGGQSKYDVANQFGKSTPYATSHHKVPEGTQLCTDCHNPHGGLDIAGTPWPRLLQSSADSTQHSGNQFCFSCHQNSQGTNTPAINPANFPANGVGHNNSSFTINGVTPFNPGSGSNIRCLACHSEHGSALPRLLNTDPDKNSNMATGNDKSFCFSCHVTGSANGRYAGQTVFNNSKHSLTTSSNTNTSFPGVGGQAGQCLNCHDPHGTTNGTSLVPMKTLRAPYSDIPVTSTNKGSINYTPNNFSFCFQCHNNTSSNAKYDIQTLYTDNGTTKGGHYIKTAGGNLAVGSKLPCEDCHSLHGSANNNKYSINDSLGSNLGDGRNECLACHQAGKVIEGITMSPLPSSVAQHTDNVTACLSCHGNSHLPNSGISQGGTDCISCHSGIANAMKSTTSGYHHLMSNTSPSYTIVQNGSKNCLSCHVDHNKFNNDKSSNLKSSYNQSFSTADQTNTGALNSDFNPADTTNGGVCLSCHQNKQTKSYTQPTGSSETPAISVSNFATSSHSYSVLSSYRDGTNFNAVCSKCHNDTMTKDKQVSTNKFSVHDSTYQSLLTPFDGTGVTAPIMDEKFCYKCHSGTGTTDPYGQTMSAQSKSLYDVFNATTGSKHTLGTAGLTCTSCHDSHAANNSNQKSMTTAPAASGILTNVIGVDPTYSTTPWTAPTFDANSAKPLTNEYQLCYKCHSNYSTTTPSTSTAGTTLTNVAMEFSSSNPSYHWIGMAGTSSKATTNGTYVNGFTPTTKLYCTNCHGSAGTDVTKPGDIHGSSNPDILKAPFSSTLGSNTSNLLCFSCHDKNTYGGGSGGQSGFSNGTTNLHNLGAHKPSGGLVCANCHSAVPHGAQRSHLIVTISDGTPYNSNALLSSYNDPGSGKYSLSSCGSNVSQCH